MNKNFLHRFILMYLFFACLSFAHADIGHAEATRRVQSAFPGTVLSVEQSNKKDGYRVKLITPDHQIRVLWVDGESGTVGGYGERNLNNSGQYDFYETSRSYRNNGQTESFKSRRNEYKNR